MLVCLNCEVPEIDTNALAITLRHHPRLRRIASKENVHPLPVAVCVSTQDSLQLDYLQAETLRSKRRAVSTKKSQQEKCTEQTNLLVQHRKDSPRRTHPVALERRMGHLTRTDALAI
eukprot:COSAG06_NODE_2199_length_7365_cov_4.321222_8_plen_117_part_00